MQNLVLNNDVGLGWLAQGAEAVFQYAVNLHSEARLLQKANYLSRSLFLFQISLEEYSKIEMLAASIVSLLMGEKIELKRIQKIGATMRRKIGPMLIF